VLNDSIMSATFGNKGGIHAEKEYLNISYGNGTIIVKDNRLVTGNSINSEDRAYVVASRSYDDGKYYAFIVKIDDKTDSNFFTIYRGRIANINENKDFTLESYSELKGVEWNYYNTPRTFRITYDTQILGDDGVVGQRDFTDYGDSSYKSRTVYVLSHGADAVLISTAPYGNINVKGKILNLYQKMPMVQRLRKDSKNRWDLNSRTQKFTICNRICGWTVKTWILTFLKTALYLRTTKL